MGNAYWAVAAMAIAVAGCTIASYPEPASIGPTATLSFARDHRDNFGEAATQSFSISENGQCTDTKEAASLLWATPQTQTARVAAGHTVIVLAKTTYFYGGHETYDGSAGAAGSPIRHQECGAAASFLAEAGHTYNIHEVAVTAGNCPLRVVDAATDQAPASLKVDNDDGDVCTKAVKG